MRHTPRTRSFFFATASIILLLGFVFSYGRRASAENPISVGPTGQPAKLGTFPINYTVDAGALGGLTNAQANSLVAQAFGAWSGVTSATVSAVQNATPGLPGPGGDISTIAQYNSLNTTANCTSLNPIVYDTDGTLTDALLGAGASNSVLGFAGPCAINNNNVILGGHGTINGKPLAGVPTALDQSRTLSVMIHELGHFLGLGHSQVNLNCLTNLASCPNGSADLQGVPTMFPILLNQTEATNQAFGVTLSVDDIASISNLYPAASFNTAFGTISGKVLFSDSVTPVQGANVIARRVGDSRVTAVSNVSGGLASANHGNGVIGLPASQSGSSDSSIRGNFTIPGLPPGTYTLEVESAYSSFTGGSNLGPLSAVTGRNENIPIPGPNECYAGVNESNADGAAACANIVVAAGSSTTNQNFILNTILSTMDAYDATARNESIFAPSYTSSGTIHASISSQNGSDTDVYAISVLAGQTLTLETMSRRLSPATYLDTVLDITDATGLQPQTCNIGDASGSFTSACVDDDFTTSGGLFTRDSKLQFKPATSGLVFVRVSDHFGDARPDFLYDLIVTGAQPVPTVTFTPPVLIYGQQNVGASVTKNVQVQNESGSAVTLNSVSITTGSADYSIVAPTGAPAPTPACNLAGTTPLAAGGVCFVGVKFTPSAAGARPGVVHGNHTAADNPAVLNASGTGASGPLNDNFANAFSTNTNPYSDIEDTTLATQETGTDILMSTAPCSLGSLPANDKSIWYKYHVPVAGTAQVQVIAPYNAALAIGIGPLPLQSTACFPIAANSNSTLNIDVTGAVGADLYFMVAAQAGDGGANTIFSMTFAPTGVNADLSIAATTGGAIFTEGSKGTYTLTVSNAGGSGTTPTTAAIPIVVTDFLANGLTLSDTTGSDAGWSCSQSGPIVTCNDANTLANGASTKIVLNVNVAPPAAANSPVQNIAQVFGGGDHTPLNNITNPPVSTIVNPAPAPGVGLSPSPVDFGNVLLTTTAATQTITLTNSGTAPLNISSIALTGTDTSQFTLITAPNGGFTCQPGASVIPPSEGGANASCTFGVGFSPTSAGAKSAKVTVTSNAASSPNSVPLSGIGVLTNGSAVLSLDTTTANFPDTVVGNASSTQQATLSNAGPGTATIVNIISNGPNVTDFGSPPTAAGDCAIGTVLNAGGAGSSCLLRGFFAPNATGARTTGIQVIASGTANSPIITLNGNGLPGPAASLSWSVNPVTFPSQVVGTTSSLQQTVLSNAGPGPATILALSFGGTNASDFAQVSPQLAGDCKIGMVLAASGAGSSCTFRATITPLLAGARSATLTFFATNSAGTPATLNFTGTGTGGTTINFTGAANDGGKWETPGNWDVNRVPNSSDTVGINVGQTATISGTTPAATVSSITSASGGSLVISGSSLAYTANSSVNSVTISGGTLTAGARLDLYGTLNLSSGTLNETGGTAILHGPVNWSGGTITGTVATTISVSNPGSLTISGAGTKTVSVNSFIMSAGTVNTITGTGTIAGNANIQTNGSLDFTVDASFSGTGQWTNTGTLKKSGGSGTSGMAQTFFNQGTILAQSGTVAFSGAFTQQGGPITVSTGATMSFPGGATLSGGTTTLATGATINAPSSFNLTGGSVLGTGTIVGNVTNSSGFVAPGSTLGTLNITGNYIQNGGTLTIELGGTAAGTFDKLAISGTATLAGTLFVTSSGGFVPAQGNNFQVMTFASKSGDFANNTFNGLGVSKVFSGTDLTLTVPITTNNFVGPGNKWETGTNWSLGHAPTSAEDVTISGSFSPLIDSVSLGQSIKSLTMTSTGTLTISGSSLTVANASTATNITVSGGTLTANGTLSISGTSALSAGTLNGTGGVTFTGPLTWSGGTMSGSGSTTISNTGSLTLSGATGKTLTSRSLTLNGPTTFSGTGSLTATTTTITNTGVFDLQVDSVIVGSGTFVNSGTFKKSGGTTNSNSGFLNNGGGTLAFQNSGTVQALSGNLNFDNGFTQSAGSTSVASGASVGSDNVTTAINGGTLSGLGYVNGNLTNAATVNPGASPGHLKVRGNYTQTSAGSLNIELGGTAFGSYDFLEVNGTATLAGNLNVTSFGGFTPANTNSFPIVAFASKTGDFTTNNLTVNGVTLTKFYTATFLTLAFPGQQGSVQLDRTSANFGSVQVGTASLPGTIVLSNPGPGDVTIGDINGTGVGANSDYDQDHTPLAGDCVLPGLITAGASCNLRAVFQPQALGNRPAHLTIIAANSTNSPTFDLAGIGIAGPATAIFNIGGGSQTAAVNSAYTQPLLAAVQDANGFPVAGVTVTFTLPGGGAGGTFAGGVNTAITDGGGVARAPVLTANGTAGTFNVTAEAGAVTGATYNLNNVAATDKILTIAGGGPGAAPPPTGNICAASYFGGIFGGYYYYRSCNQVYKAPVGGGAAVLVAGTGVAGFSGDGGAATNAELTLNSGAILVNNFGDVYMADSGNNRIRVVNGHAVPITINGVTIQPGNIQTVAGIGSNVPPPPNRGDGGPAPNAFLAGPQGVSLDSSGNIFIADTGAQRIRVVNVQSSQITVAGTTIEPGTIETVAGSGLNTPFNGDGFALGVNLNGPQGVFADTLGNIFIADTNFNRIRKVAPDGSLTTVAGTGAVGYNGDGTATSSSLNGPNAVYVDGSGNVFISDNNNERIRKISGTTISTIAGNGSFGFSGEGVAATSARIASSNSVFADGSGNVYFSNFSGIREVVSGNIQTLVGNSAYGYFGDGGPATSAQLFSPVAGSVTIDSFGNVYFADIGNYRIREVVGATGQIVTVAGNGGSGTPSPDGAIATSASTSIQPAGGVVVDSQGNIFYIEHSIGVIANCNVREIVKTTGALLTIAGNGACAIGAGENVLGTSVGIGLPIGIALDSSGNVYISTANRVRVVNMQTSPITVLGVTLTAKGNIATVAGNGTAGFADGVQAAGSATITNPQGLAVDTTGNLFIADSGNQRVRKVANTGTPGLITTIAGTGSSGLSGDGGPATSAQVFNPGDVAVDTSGNLFILDPGNARIRKVSGGTIQTVAGDGIRGFAGDGGLAINSQLNISNAARIALDSSGHLYINDLFNARIRFVGTPNPVPTITSLVPPSATAGGSGFVLTVNGTGFVNGATVIFNGNPRVTTFVNSTQLTATILAGDIAVAGSFPVTVSNPEPTSGPSAATNFTVNLPQASVAVTPNPVPFGNQPVLITSSAATITVTNSGTASATLSAGTPVTISGTNSADFAIASGTTCVANLVLTASGGTCVIKVTFTPGALGARTATVNVADNAPGTPQQTVMAGTGVQATVILNPTPVGFGNQRVGTPSAATTITVTNSGTSSATLSAGTPVTITGTNLGDFAVVTGTTCTAGVVLTPSGGSCIVNIVFTPGASGARTATLNVADDAPGSPQQATLNGTGVLANVGLAPNPVPFGNQKLSVTSAAQTITVTNAGTFAATLTGTPVTITGTNAVDFAIASGTTCVGNLVLSANGGSCVINVTFTPGALGARTAIVNVADDAPGTPQTTVLNGTGVQANLAVTPNPVPFGNQRVGAASAAQTVTVTNSGTLAATLSAGTPVTITGTNAGDFALASGTTCVANFVLTANGGSCVINVTFTPGALGARTATVSVADDAPGTPQQTTLNGTGVQANVGVAPNPVPFSNQKVGTISAAQTVTVTNSGTLAATLTGTPVAITGPNSADFAIASGTTCVANFVLTASGGSCVIKVTFTPGATGARTATVNVADDAPGTPQQTTLNGTGVAASVALAPNPVSFANQKVATTSSAQTITVTNSGTLAATLASATPVTFTGINASDFAIASGTTCVANFVVTASGGSCLINVTFTPGATGARTATVNLADDAPGTPQQTTLNGTGVLASVAAAPNPVAFGNQKVGAASAAQTITVTNSGTLATTLASATPVTFTGTNSGDFAIASGTTCVANFVLTASGGSCLINVTFTPGATGARTATVNVSDDTPGTPQQTTLNGTGVLASVAAAPNPVPFGNQKVGTASATQTITVANSGTLAATLASAIPVTFTGTNASDFAIASGTTCVANFVLAAGGGSCVINVTFTPGALGARTATVNVADDAPGNPQITVLNGTGVLASVAAAPNPVPFGNQKVGTASTAQTITVTNSGTLATTLASATPVTFTGTNSGDFAIASGTTCVASFVLTANGGSCVIKVTFTPGATGPRAATVNIADDAPGAPQQTTLNGTGVQANVAVTPNPVPFGNQALTFTSSAATITVTNSGTLAATLTAGTPITFTGANPGDFAISSGTTCVANFVLAASGGSCVIKVTFTPAALGARTATVNVADDAPGSPQQTVLTGTGVQATLILNPAPVGFGNQRVSVTSGVMAVTVANNGTSSATLAASTPVTIAGTNASDFAIAAGTTCVANFVLNPSGGSCVVNLTFTPGATGARTATLSVADDAPGSPQQATLTGTGVIANVAVAPNPVPFGNQKVSVPSTAQTITVTNSGTLAATLIAGTPVTITGVNAGDFAIAGGTTCVANFLLAAGGGSCIMNVTFTPGALGARTATVNVADDAPGTPQQTILNGTGAVANVAVAPNSVPFGNQKVSFASAAQTISVTNTGGVAATLASITPVTFTGTNAGDFATASGTTCVANFVLAAGGGSCVINVTFTPGALGARTATLNVADDAPGSPQQTALTGTGALANVAVAPNPVPFGNQKVGAASAAQTITVTNSGAVPATLAAAIPVTISGTNLGDFAIASGTTCVPNFVLTASGGSCIINVTFTPGATGARTATVNVANDAPATPQQTILNGTGVQANVAVIPNPVPFANQKVATTSGAQTITVTNSGTFAATLAAATPVTITGTNPGDFAIAAGTTCVANFVLTASGGSCVINVTFTPAATGARTATVNVAHDAPGTPQQTVLNGTGVAANVALAPTPVPFGNQKVATTSTAQTITVTNSGTLAATLGAGTPVTITGTNASDFAIAGGTTCVANFILTASGGSCVIKVAFTPGATGARTATVNVADDGPGTPQQATLNGTGVLASVALAPNPANLGSINLNKTTPAQTITVTNSGTLAATLSAGTPVTITGANSGDFAIASGTTCVANFVLAASGGSCIVNVTFTPTALGARTATVNVADDAPGTPQQATLNGTGTKPTAGVAPSPTLAIGNVTVNDNKTASVTLSNTGTGQLTVAAIAISGTNASEFSQTNTCGTLPAQVAAAANCVITVKLIPTAIGARSATLTITDDDNAVAGSTQVVNLAGTGVDFAVAQATPGTVSITGGTPATVTLNLTTTGGALASAVNFTCAVPASLSGTTCSLNPTSIAAGNTTGTTTLTVNTTANLAPPPQKRDPRMPYLPLAIATVLSGLMAIFFAARQKFATLQGRAGYATVALLLIAIAGLAGCTTAIMSTPKGASTVTVTATSGSITKTTTVNINVN